MSQLYSVKITKDDPALWDLKRSWTTAEFSAHDGIAPIDSLHQAGDSVVAVAQITSSRTQLIGSGVMVGPGLLLTATHVLDEFPKTGGPPVFMTFLPDGARAWLATEVVANSGPSAFGEDRRIKSDISLVSCTLNSDAKSEYPLNLAPLQIALPLVGDRLWALGFRHNDPGDPSGSAGVAPLVSSGLVTAAFPHGRGERMPAACIEVAMDTWGGMSGGPVANADGFVVGIVSSSFDGGPTYVTLIWDVLKHSVKSSWPPLVHRANSQVNLLTAKDIGFVRLKGDVKRFRRGDLRIRLTGAETQLMLASVDPSTVKGTDSALNEEQLEEFEEEHSDEIEEIAARIAINHLESLTVASVREFLEASDVPESCLTAITAFSVEDFEGVEDLEILSNKNGLDETILLSCAYDLLSVYWTVEVPTAVYESNATAFQDHFLNVTVNESVTELQMVQRCYFEVELKFDTKCEEFTDSSVKLTAVHRHRKR